LKKDIAGWADFLAIRVLLPTHVMLSTQVMDGLPTNLLAALVIGAAMPLICYATGRWLSKLVQSAVPSSLPLVGATFGGGNRGILLISLLMAFHVAPEFHSQARQQPTILDFFVVMDLAYFLVFLAVVPPLHYVTTAVDSLKAQSLLAQAVSSAIVIFSFGLAFVGFKLLQAEAWVDARYFLGVLVTVICTALVIVHARFEVSLQVFRQVATVFAARALAIAALGIAGWVWAAPDTVTATHLLIALSVFLLVPPSSYAPSIIGRYEPDDQVEQAATLAVTWNVMYLILVGGVLFAGVIRLATSSAAI